MLIVSYILLALAGLFAMFGVYLLLKSYLKFGQPYKGLREEMEVIRKELKEEELSGKYPESRIDSTIEAFNRNARKLGLVSYHKN